ncbi:MAG: hypothetical protein ABIO48_14960 [Pedococcus sp.]
MKIYRCRCGQALAGFATGFAETGLPFSQDFVDRAVDAALDRHLARMAEQDRYNPHEHGREGRSRERLLGVPA